MNAVTGDNPYTWTISNLPIGIPVKFTESVYDINGYSVVAKVTDSVHNDDDGIEGTAPSALTPGRVSFKNTYTPGIELPATGGSGTQIYAIAGIVLIVLAGVLLVSRRKRRT